MIQRKLEEHIKNMLTKYPVVSVTGPRQSGKTTLLKSAFSDYKYFNLERADYRTIIQSDPVGFLKDTGDKVIFDEAQNIPELFSYIQVISDERNTTGQYILSGSQSFLLNERISQSLAGRVSINHLLPFDISELPAERAIDFYQTIINGFYPRIHDKNILPEHFYPSYIQTYIDRDVRLLKNIGNLSAFSRFIQLCAGRTGQVLNITSLANDSGIAVNTAKSWISLLQASFIIYLVQPYYKNFSKRVIKSPKLYFYDTGVLTSLLNIKETNSLKNHYLLGAIFENLVISELIKMYSHRGQIPGIYYWRESNGNEIDCLLEIPGNRLLAIEIKAGQTYNKGYLKNLMLFSKVASEIQKVVVYTGDQSFNILGTEIISWKDFHKNLGTFGISE